MIINDSKKGAVLVVKKGFSDRNCSIIKTLLRIITTDCMASKEYNTVDKAKRYSSTIRM
jgi:hypothetical protein